MTGCDGQTDWGKWGIWKWEEREDGQKDKNRVKDSMAEGELKKRDEWRRGRKDREERAYWKENRDKKIKKRQRERARTERNRERESDRKGGYLSFSSRWGLMVALCASVKRSINIMACWMLGLCGPADYCCYNGRQAVYARSGVSRNLKTWAQQKKKKKHPLASWVHVPLCVLKYSMSAWKSLFIFLFFSFLNILMHLLTLCQAFSAVS